MNIGIFTFSVLEFGGGNEKFFIDASINLASNPNTKVTIVTMSEDYVLKLQKILSIYYRVKIDKKFIKNESTEYIKQKLGSVVYQKLTSFKELQKILKSFDVLYIKGELLEISILKFIIGYNNLPKIVACCETALVYGVVNSIHSRIHNFLYSGLFFKYIASGISGFQVLNKADEYLIKNSFPSVRVLRIPNPLNHIEFAQLEMQNKINIPLDTRNKKIILWAGRFDEQKGVFDLLSAIEALFADYGEKVIWLVCGFGVHEKEVAGFCSKYKNVYYFGRVNYNFMPSLYKNSDLFLTTSRWEGSPFVVIESFAMGTPVLSYNVSGCSDLIIENENGLLANNYDELLVKIKKFLDDEYKFTRELITKKFFEENNANMQYKKIFNFIYECYSKH